MQEKIGQIEEQLCQLSMDLTQLLSRVEAMRQALSELKIEPEAQPVNSIAIEMEDETTEYDLTEEINVQHTLDSSYESEVSCLYEQQESYLPDLHIQEVSTDMPELPEEPNGLDMPSSECDHSNMELRQEPQQPDESDIDMPDEEPDFPPLPPIPPLVAAEDERVNLEEWRKLFTINDTYRFRRELFGNDGIAMSDTINMIAAMRSMSEVEDYVYSDLEWDKENDDVRAFMDIVTFYFMQKR